MISIKCAQLCRIVSTKQSSSPAKATIPDPKLPSKASTRRRSEWQRLHHALDIADSLAGEISIEVINPRTVKPLDIETLAESAKETGRVVVADESLLQNGPASYIAERIESEAFYCQQHGYKMAE